MLTGPLGEARRGLIWSGTPTLPYPRWWGPGIPMWTLTTHLAPLQVKICGAGRSRILQALAHRPETLSDHGPEKEKSNNCLLSSIWQEPRGLRACPTSNPSWPTRPTRHEAKGSTDQESGVSNSSLPQDGGGRVLRQNTLLPGTH